MSRDTPKPTSGNNSGVKIPQWVIGLISIFGGLVVATTLVMTYVNAETTRVHTAVSAEVATKLDRFDDIYSRRTDVVSMQVKLNEIDRRLGSIENSIKELSKMISKNTRGD